MREIKFRVPIYYGGTFSHFLYWSNKGDRIEFEPDDAMRGDGIFLPHGERAARDSEQFTGLRDKNGREIYEGDIVAVGAPDSGNIHNTSIVFSGCGFRLDKGHGALLISANKAGNIEVIGNIHENPELVAKA